MKLAVVLHNIRSVQNVGSIFRTADAAGASVIYCCGITPAPVDRLKKIRPDFAKVALGAEEYVPWKSVKRTAAAIKELKEEGYAIFAVEQSKKAVPYYEAAVGREKTGKKVALVLGNEVDGIPTALLRKVDRILEIPMFGKKESLNVAVSFGIVAFGVRRGYYRKNG